MTVRCLDVFSSCSLNESRWGGSRIISLFRHTSFRGWRDPYHSISRVVDLIVEIRYPCSPGL